MPGARGVKRTASKASSTAAAALPKNKKKRVVVQLEIPTPSKRRGRVLTCGQGDVGQLGLGEDVMEITRFKHVSDLKDNIVQVVAGGMHTVALDSDGKVWTFGCNDEGALGRSGPEAVPGAVPLPAPACALSAGDSHSAALLLDGSLYAWGAFRDSHGSMGLVAEGGGRAGKPCLLPAKLHLPEPVAGLASGQDHLLLLTVSGAVYTLGCGEQGQLGRVSQRSASRDTRLGFSPLLTPTRVGLKFSAGAVWAGYHASIALDPASGRLHAWGLNNYNQLGVSGDKRRQALYAPVQCDAFGALDASWTQLALGQHHSVALAADGAVYTVGRCEYGRLGHGADCGDAETPRRVQALAGRRCVSVAAGTSNSFAVSADGVLYGWGMGSEGQLGTGACEDSAEPAPADPRHLSQHRAAAVSAGGQHTVLLAVSIKNVESTEVDEKGVEEQAEQPAVGKAKSAPSAASKKQEVPVAETSEKATDETTARPKRKMEQQPVESNSTNTKKQKINGDDIDKDKDTEMEVEDTDKTEEPAADKKEDAAKLDEPAEKKQDMDIDKNTTSEDTNTDTSSQDSVEQQAAATTAAATAAAAVDVHMNDAPLNGTPQTLPTKTAEVQSANVVTTVA